MIRIAAVGDVHVDKDVVGRYRPALDRLPEVADALLVAGDLTRHGTVDEARCFTEEFGGLGVPVVVVLGNHDHQSDQQDDVAKVLPMPASPCWRAARRFSTCMVTGSVSPGPRASAAGSPVPARATSASVR